MRAEWGCASLEGPLSHAMVDALQVDLAAGLDGIRRRASLLQPTDSRDGDIMSTKDISTEKLQIQVELDADEGMTELHR